MGPALAFISGSPAQRVPWLKNVEIRKRTSGLSRDFALPSIINRLLTQAPIPLLILLSVSIRVHPWLLNFVRSNLNP